MKPFETKINQFPVDKVLKYEIACLITAYMAQLGIDIDDEKQQQFQDKFSEQLIESVLDAIVKWEETKLN